MANNKEKTYWPHMILGFLLIGITLGYWTVKHSVALPVQESNTYIMKYQQADIHINNILAKKAHFDATYKIELRDVKREKMILENAKRAKDETVVVLHRGKNSFNYSILTKQNQIVEDANVTFLLTRPHTTKDDNLKENIAPVDGVYKVENVDIVKAGRYILQLRVAIGDKVGYLKTPAYLKP